ncbi:hypothetical protein FF1_008235 [Malus domestica]
MRIQSSSIATDFYSKAWCDWRRDSSLARKPSPDSEVYGLFNASGPLAGCRVPNLGIAQGGVSGGVAGKVGAGWDEGVWVTRRGQG